MSVIDTADRLSRCKIPLRKRSCQTIPTRAPSSSVRETSLLSFSCTCLGRAPLDRRYGDLALEAVHFLPPYWPNAEMIVRIVTAAGGMHIEASYSQRELDDASVPDMLDEALGLLC